MKSVARRSSTAVLAVALALLAFAGARRPPEIPPEIRPLVQKLLDAPPRERSEIARELGEAIRRYLRGDTGGGGGGEPPAATLVDFALSPDGINAWYPSPAGDVLWQVNTSTGEIFFETALPHAVTSIAANSFGTQVAALSASQNAVTFIQVAYGPVPYYPPSVTTTVPTNRGPRVAQFDDGDTTLCILSPPSKTVEGISTSDPFSKTVETTFPDEPFGMGHSPAGSAVSFPATGSLVGLDLNHNPVRSVNLAPGAEWVSSGRGLILVTSAQSDSVWIVSDATFEVLATVGVADPVRVEAPRGPSTGAYVLLNGGTTIVRIECDAASPDFGTMTASLSMPEPIEAMSVAPETGVCFALAATRRTLYRIEAATVTAVPVSAP